MGKGKGLVRKIRYIIVFDIESGHFHEHTFMMLDAWSVKWQEDAL